MLSKRFLSILLILSVYLFSASAFAQRSGEEGGRTIDYKEVEKGFFSELDLGPLYALSGFSQDSGLKMGFMTSIGFGYDIADYLSFDAGVGVLHWSSGGPTECTIGQDAGCDPPADDPLAVGQKVTPAPSDLFGVAPRFSVKLSFISTFRTYFFLRAGGGVMLANPDDIVGSSAPIVEGSLGVEYYTGLRHFSIGIEPRVFALMASSGTAISLGLIPTLKYTF
ncbi:MAG: hypothetical protein Kow0090_14730 [Myxococcota bacterium]